MLAITGINILVSIAVAMAMQHLFQLNANPVNAMLAEASNTARILFYLKTAPQLFGEER